MSVITLQTINQHHWRWPDWPAGLYEDSAGHHFEGDQVDRVTFDECAAAVGEFNRPALLDDLVDDGTIDLAWPEMAGVIAVVWSTSEYAESALARERWVDLFRADGFSDGGRPTEPVRLYRGAIPAVMASDERGRLVAVDAHGCPVDPHNEVVESWHTTTGMAWTASRRAARGFARRGPWGREYGEVFTATVDPEHLLARMGTDYVVDPADLTDVAPVGVRIAEVSR